MKEIARTRDSTLGVIIGLVISIWWIFMGLDRGFRFEAIDGVCHWLTLGGYRHTIMTILALALVPVCALKVQWGFLATMALGGATLTLSGVHVVYMLIVTPSGYESQLFGPIVWSVMQIPIIVFGYWAWQGAGRRQ
jgi:DMSO/TMAO reductase YedYZ heme-binding membrane subunit